MPLNKKLHDVGRAMSWLGHELALPMIARQCVACEQKSIVIAQLSSYCEHSYYYNDSCHYRCRVILAELQDQQTCYDHTQ